MLLNELPSIVGPPHVDESHQKLEDLLLEDVGDELLVLAERGQKTENEDLKQRKRATLKHELRSNAII